MTTTQGGLPGFRGFEYQIEATVWVALHVMHETAVCSSIIVEPRSSEDVELDVSADEALSTVTIEGGPTKRFMLQFKTRGTGPWTKGAFGTVIGDGTPAPRAARGPQPRPRALETLLGQVDFHYVLVTNASCDSLVFRLGPPSLLTPPPGTLPAGILHESVTAAEAASLQGRIAILHSLTSELVALRTKALISTLGRVPLLRVAECLDALKHQVRQRLLGLLPAPLSREDINREFRKHYGAPPDAIPGPAYFPPMNFAAIESALAARNVVLLLGPPGMGKTSTAQHLLEVHRRRAIPFAICRERVDSGVIESHLRELGPVYFLISDPWGVSDNRGRSALTHELPRLIRSANADKRFVITSRSDVYEDVSSGTQLALKPFVVPLTLQDYSEETLWSIATQRFSDQAAAVRLATRARTEILKKLQTPLELALFSDLFLTAYVNNPAWADAVTDASLLQMSLPIAIEVTRLIEKAASAGSGQFAQDVLVNWRDAEVEHVAICWTLFEAFEALSEQTAITLLESVGKRLGVQLHPQEFLDFLKANNIAEEREYLLTIHSMALKGMRDFLNGSGPSALRAVECLADHYVTQFGSGAEGTVERAIWVIRAWENGHGRVPNAFSSASKAIDRRLGALCLTGSHDEFVNAVFAAMNWTRATDLFVRFVRSWGPDESDSTPPWFPPNFSDADVEELMASGMPAQFLPRFVMEFLPNTRIWYGFENRDFVQFVKRFRVNLERATRAALELMHDRKFVDRGDGATDIYYEDVNEGVLRALLAEYTDVPFPPPPAATAPWDL